MPDTVEGRFEVLSLHIYALLKRFKRQSAEADAFAQAFFDVFFNNMDDSLREMGVGDMTIGRKIRTMAETFYGRVAAYETALDNDDENQLAEAVARNVFTSNEAADGLQMAQYLTGLVRAFEEQPLDSLMAGTVSFPAPDQAFNDSATRKTDV